MSYESWRISYQSSEQAARAAYTENQRLAAALEAAREDAARYRWLCDNRPDVVGGIAGEGFVVTLRWADADICAATLDAAIDAAREARNG